MTHAELVARAQRWLRNTKRHAVVLAEIQAITGEQPDVIGWMTNGTCTLVECKTSRSDFMADRAKPFRRDPTRGLGGRRMYFAPPGVIRVIDLPERWGLAEAHKNVVRVVKEPEHFEVQPDASFAEKRILLSAIQRVTEGWGRKVFGDISPVHGKLDPHPSVKSTIDAYRNENMQLREQLRQLGLRNE